MKLLGLRLCEHDSSFAFFDGSIVKYHKLERTKQVKHFAYNSLTAWVDDFEQIFQCKIADVDQICIAFDPWRYNLSLENEKFFPTTEFKHFDLDCKVVRINHHYAHALSAWMLTDYFDKAIIIDGFGDHDNAWTIFDKDNVLEIGSHKLHGSIGTEMAQAGKFLGIQAEHGIDVAGKLMGLQAYGEIDQEYLNFLQQFDMYKIKEIFNCKNWIDFKGQVLGQNLLLNWIATVHYRIGEVLGDFFATYCEKNETVVYAGGVAQNVIWNTILKEKFPNIIIPPHCADDGLSLGALEFLRIQNKLPKFKIENFPFSQQDIIPATDVSDNTIDIVAELLMQGKTIGWYQNSGEVGPRALGNRSILIDPRISNAKEIVNKIKNREEYRPFGASILEEYANEYFNDIPKNPFMLFVGKLKQDKNLTSITHIDQTCRVQTVGKNTGSFRKLLEKFYEKTGCPVLLNTSLNVAGKPLAGNPYNVYELFKSTTLDCFVIGDDYAIKEN